MNITPRLNSFASYRYLVFILGVFIVAAAVVAVPVYSVRSNSSLTEPSRSSKLSGAPAKQSQPNLLTASHSASLPSWSSAVLSLAPVPQAQVESITTYNTDCITPQSDFNLGETVCAKATGVPVTPFTWHVAWVDPVGFIRQSDTASPDPQTEYRYTIPATQTSTINGQTVDNRGTWRVNLTRFNGQIRQTARFTVHQPASPVADVFVQKFARSGDSSVASGGNIAFIIVVGNQGPDEATAVHLVDSPPTGFTLVSFTQQSGPACLPVDTNPCTMATMTNGDRAEFTAVYNSGTAPQGTYSTSVTVVPVSSDPNTDNNTSTSEVIVKGSGGGGGGTCELTCPTNITVTANTTENGESGAHVTFPAPATSGDCGTVSTSPASGSFFPVGTSVVTASSTTGDGACSFSVTVEEANANVSISCPANQTGTANNDCEAVITVGNPSVTGANVTFHGTRSDGKPMYNCDCFPSSPNQVDDACNVNGACTRRADAPFSAGVTVITWTAYSHSSAGPYATPEAEDAARTGSASCQQTITVYDTTPPVITAVDSTVSADANCQAAVPDYTNSVTDNCSCAASDTSQDCVGQHRITVTQDPAAGTMVGIGPHTIHLTANDGASNPGPDGIPETADDGTGNETTKDVVFTVEDRTAPVIHCPSNITTNTDPAMCSAVVAPGTATATDNCDSTPTITGTRSDNKPLTDPYPKGTTTITWTATDDAGNHSSCSQTVTVEDHEAPVIVCPASVVQGNDPGTCSATVNPGQPTVTDNCDGNPTVTSSRSDGQAMNAPYPKGTTTITWTATDASGNHASCTQTVTVEDREAPVITVSGQQSMWPPNHKYRTFGTAALVASVHDNCDGNIAVGSVVITKVTSDEIENGNGDGNTLNDIVIAPDCKSVQLRSEREGNSDGRVYRIFFSVVDAAGNEGTASTTVVVQHNPGQTAVDSGPHYTVTCGGL